MKKTFIYLMAAASMNLISCGNLLEEDVRSQITDNYLSTPNGFEDGVKACYSFLRDFYGFDENGASATVFGTDLFTNGFDGGKKYMNSYNPNLNPRNATTAAIWNDLYVGINTCNAVITRAPDVEGLDDQLRNIRLAETRFLRGQFYFLLVQLFGPLHLTLTETEGVQTEASRVPIAEVYDAIISDLDFAVQTLPVVASDYGRATKPAAEHLLSKVYLTRAGSDAQQAGDYQKAAELAMHVINEYDFQLVDDFAELFEQGENEKNPEVIFSVQNSKNLMTSGNADGSCCDGGNTLHTYFLMKYDDLPGMTRDLANGRPWARFKPTEFLLQTLFDRQYDSRFEKSFKRVFYCNDPGTYTTINGHQVTLALGDTAIFIPDREWSDTEISQAGYSVYTPSMQTERVYPVLNKFLDPERPDVQEMRGSRDILIFRLAETYLIAGEALMMSDQPAEAVTYINIVRRRAARTGETDSETAANKLAMEITAADLSLDFVLDERGRELAGELMRWFDLVRTGKLIERVKKYNPVAAANIKPYHVLRPIPQDQIDRTSTEFNQNDGYN